MLIADLPVSKNFPLLLLPLWVLFFFLIPAGSELIAMTGIDAFSLIPFLGGYFFVLLTVVLSIPIGCIALFQCCFLRDKSALLVVLFCFIAVISSIVGGISAQRIRDFETQIVIQRAKPIIAAIETFESKNGNPPENLSQLVPKYIAEIPKINFYSFSNYSLEPGSGDTSWKLKVSTSDWWSLSNFLDTEYMFYTPYTVTYEGERIPHTPDDWDHCYERW